MKRIVTFALLLCLVAAGAYAHSALTIRPSDMKDGETKTFEEDGRKITITKKGDALNVEVEGAGGSRTVTIVGGDRGIRIERDGSRPGISVIPPGELRERIIAGELPGFDVDQLPRFRRFPRDQKLQNWFVCPKDKTLLRVPDDAGEKEFNCPVDGTKMEKRNAKDFRFFFFATDDDDEGDA
ncbi:MAG TPA: hypothetical protein VF698_15405 [Thermoanaerobaculia bacterium]|jgi:hypothetical protein